MCMSFSCFRYVLHETISHFIFNSICYSVSYLLTVFITGVTQKHQHRPRVCTHIVAIWFKLKASVGPHTNGMKLKQAAIRCWFDTPLAWWNCTVAPAFTTKTRLHSSGPCMGDTDRWTDISPLLNTYCYKWDTVDIITDQDNSSSPATGFSVPSYHHYCIFLCLWRKVEVFGTMDIRRASK